MGFVKSDANPNLYRSEERRVGKECLHQCRSRTDNYLQKMGFVKSDADPNLYYLRVGDEPLMLVLYVIGLFLTGPSRLIKDYKENLATEFDMKDLGLIALFSGVGSLAAEWGNLP